MSQEDRRRRRRQPLFGLLSLRFPLPFVLIAVLSTSAITDALKCTECPYSPVPPHAVDCKDTCEGDICYIVVNAFFNGTLSAGCITVRPGDTTTAAAPPRQHCHREPEKNRTVCACTTADYCNGPKTPIVDYDFIPEAILEGYSLIPSPRTEPSFVLSTDRPSNAEAELPEAPRQDQTATFSVTSSMIPARSTMASTITTAIPLAENTSGRPILSASPSTTSATDIDTLSATGRPRPPPGPFRLSEGDDEEPTIEVKSSVFIKPNEEPPLGAHDMNPSARSSSSPPPHSFAASPTTSIPLLSGSGRPRVLPTDPGQTVGEDGEIVVVKTVGLEVKEDHPSNSTHPAEAVRLPLESSSAQEGIPSTESSVKVPRGEGSVEETDVSSSSSVEETHAPPAAVTRRPNQRPQSSHPTAAAVGRSIASIVIALLCSFV